MSQVFPYCLATPHRSSLTPEGAETQSPRIAAGHRSACPWRRQSTYCQLVLKWRTFHHPPKTQLRSSAAVLFPVREVPPPAASSVTSEERQPFRYLHRCDKELESQGLFFGGIKRLFLGIVQLSLNPSILLNPPHRSLVLSLVWLIFCKFVFIFDYLSLLHCVLVALVFILACFLFLFMYFLLLSHLVQILET